MRIYPYEKNDSKTRKITQLCQLNLLIIDYPTNGELSSIGTCKKGGDLWLQIIWIQKYHCTI